MLKSSGSTPGRSDAGRWVDEDRDVPGFHDDSDVPAPATPW